MDLFHDDPTLPEARLLFAPVLAWFLDYYPMPVVTVAADLLIVA